MAKSFMEKLGLKVVRKLTKKICLERVKFLKKNIEKKKYKGLLLKRAKYYLNWYRWMSRNMKYRAEQRAS